MLLNGLGQGYDPPFAKTHLNVARGPQRERNRRSQTMSFGKAKQDKKQAPAPSTAATSRERGARDKALEAAVSEIEKSYGKGSIMRLGDATSLVREITGIKTGSLALDVALGGKGLPRGRIVEVYGPESSGKTTLTLHVLANAQAEGGICAFVDAEHALDPAYARRLAAEGREHRLGAEVAQRKTLLAAELAAQGRLPVGHRQRLGPSGA